MKPKLDMYKAHLLLVSTKIPIAEVGYRLGYKSGMPPAFAEETGMTPTEYRRTYQQTSSAITLEEHEGPPLVFTLHSGAHVDIPLYDGLGGKDLIHHLTELEITITDVRHLGRGVDTVLFEPYRVVLPGYYELQVRDHRIVFQVVGERLRLWGVNNSKYDLTISVRRYFNQRRPIPPPRFQVEFADLALDEVFLYDRRHWRVLDIATVDLVRRYTWIRKLRGDGEQRFTRHHRFVIEDLDRGVQRVVDDIQRKWKENNHVLVFPHWVKIVHLDTQ